nr:unnamed protein product [Callosobruchus analis]
MKTNFIQAEIDIGDLKKSSSTTVSILDVLKNDGAVLKAGNEGIKIASSDTISYADLVSNIETKALKTIFKKLKLDLTNPVGNALGVLRHKNKLPKESCIYIKYDQTQMQRTQVKNLLTEMQRKKDAGEANLRIRYLAVIY